MSGWFLAASLGVISCGGKLPLVTHASAGKIIYRVEQVPNPAFAGHGAEPRFSEKLRALIMRDNVPARRTVHFDGKRSRVDEVNFDYGVKSPAIRLREVGRASTLYCKQFPHVAFCVELPDLLPVADRVPILRLTNKTATIANLPCRKAIYNNLAQKLEVYFTDKVHVEDATRAVYHIDGVPGLIVRWQPIDDPRTDFVERVTAIETSFAQPLATLFAPPPGFRTLASVDEARSLERQLLDAEAAQHPATASERARFLGQWRLATAPDELNVEIVADGEAYLLRTTHGGTTSEQRATMKGQALQVENPPNIGLYRLSEDSNELLLVGSEAFRFARAR